MSSVLTREQINALLKKGNIKLDEPLGKTKSDDEKFTEAMNCLADVINQSSDRKAKAILGAMQANQEVMRMLAATFSRAQAEPEPVAYRHRVTKRDRDGNLLEFESHPI